MPALRTVVARFPAYKDFERTLQQHVEIEKGESLEFVEMPVVLKVPTAMLLDWNAVVSQLPGYSLGALVMYLSTQGQLRVIEQAEQASTS